MSMDTPTTPRRPWERPAATSLAVHRLTAEDVNVTLYKTQTVVHLGGCVDLYGLGVTHSEQLDSLAAVAEAIASQVERERRRIRQASEAPLWTDRAVAAVVDGDVAGLVAALEEPS